MEDVLSVRKKSSNEILETHLSVGESGGIASSFDLIKGLALLEERFGGGRTIASSLI